MHVHTKTTHLLSELKASSDVGGSAVVGKAGSLTRAEQRRGSALGDVVLQQVGTHVGADEVGSSAETYMYENSRGGSIQKL